MRYNEFEDIFSTKRMQKYVLACDGDTRRAMTLYRYNLKLSQEMFTLISCFEVALRNRIDNQMVAHLGTDWLRDLIMPGGNFYSDRSVEKTKKIITNAYNELQNSGNYSHSKLLSDHNYIFHELNFINNIRNRIAHHEPICFGNPVGIDTTYALSHYARMMTLFQWMGIDAPRMLYGLDHVGQVCSKMMCI